MSITLRQELPQNLELLAAQKNLYSRAKKIIGLQMVLSGPIAIGAAIVTIVSPDLKGYIALWGILIIGLDLFVKYLIKGAIFAFARSKHGTQQPI